MSRTMCSTVSWSRSECMLYPVLTRVCERTQNVSSACWGASGPRQGILPTHVGWCASHSNLLPACPQRTSDALEEGCMGHEFPRHRNLDSLRKEAKRWLAALRDNVGDARTRLARVLPNAPGNPTLRDVQ